jgi:colanic acid/amylovoran biosynthesis glycosyltransferase
MSPLAIVLPEIGLASETFIRWDVTHLLPGATAIIADPPPGGLSLRGETTWTLGAEPALVFDPVEGDPPPSDLRVKAALSFLDRNEVQVVLVEYLDFADRWFDPLHATGRHVWVRGHGIDLSARLRDENLAKANQRYAKADGIIVPSRHAAQTLIDLGLPGKKVHVVRYPVEIPALGQPAARDEVRCVAVGRLVAKKAPLIVLEAFRAASIAEPSLTLDLVGDGPLMTDVQAYVADQGLGERVRVHGRLDHSDALDLLRSADILLHHAVTAPDGDAEGQPLAVLEAMAAGLAVIATDHAGIPEIVADSMTGRLVAEHDTAAMTAAILDLARDQAVRERLGAAARHAIGREHTSAHARQRLLELMGLEEYS